MGQPASWGRVVVGVASQIFLTHIARRAAAALDILASNWKATRSPAAQMVIANANTSVAVAAEAVAVAAEAVAVAAQCGANAA